MVRRINKFQPRKWGADCWARNLSWFREYILQRKQGMQKGSTGEEEMRQQQRMKVIEGDDKENQVEGKHGREQQLVGQ